LSGWSGFREIYPEISKKCKYIVPFEDEGFLERYLNEIKQEEDLIVGWSLGANLIIRELDRINAKRIILIAPFFNFTDYVNKRVIDLMIRSFERNREKCVIDFWSKIGIRTDLQTKVSHSLKDGLMFLKERNNFNEVYHKRNILVIAPTNDRILPLNAFIEVYKRIFGSIIKIYSNHYIEESILERIIFDNI
jgi:pimeloyl-[acyl-carrier protein] methyl ester esterase